MAAIGLPYQTLNNKGQNRLEKRSDNFVFGLSCENAFEIMIQIPTKINKQFLESSY